jgi:shikimate kinase
MRRCDKRSRQVVLVGFMGAGKSSVGKILAERLGAEFVDVDERIEETAGQSAGEIFASCGEEAFREMEKAAIRDAVSVPGRVVAAGGGAFVDEANRLALKTYAPVFFLDVSVESVLERLSGDRSRPLFPGEKEEGKLRNLMERRRPAYQEADFTVSTDHRSVPEIADRILALLARRPVPRREGGRA